MFMVIFEKNKFTLDLTSCHIYIKLILSLSFFSLTPTGVPIMDFPVSILNAEECLTAGESFRPIIDGMDASQDRFLQMHKPVLNSSINSLHSALGKGKTSEFTEKLDSQDEFFNNTYLTFRNFCTLVSKQKAFPEEAQAAQKIVTAIRAVDWTLYNRGYTEQLAKTSTLMNEMEKEEMKEALETSGAKKWFTIMKQADAELRATYQERINSEAQDSAPAVKQAKSEMKEILVAIYDHVDRLNKLNPSEFGSVASRLEEVVRTLIPAARSRQTKKESEREENLTTIS